MVFTEYETVLSSWLVPHSSSRFFQAGDHYFIKCCSARSRRISKV